VLEAVRPLIGKPVNLQDAEEPGTGPDYDPPSDGERNRVIEALGPTPVAIDEIVAHTSLSVQQVFLILLELDLAGRLERHSGGRASLLFIDP
jgi:DNA processing protein